MNSIRQAIRSRIGLISAIVIVLVLILAIVGPWLAPQNPLKNNVDDILQGPSAQHFFGTDYLGRDVFSRLLAGSRLSVLSAFEAVGIGLVIGVIPGITSVYLGRAYEWLTLRVMDGLMALPFMIFAIAVAALLGNALQEAMVAVGILLAPSFYRLTRAAALDHANSPFVTASQLNGAGIGWIVSRHIWSKVLPTLAVATGNAVAGSLLIVSSLTFLGIGVVPPAPTWGGMLASDLGYLSQSPYGPIFPSLLIMITVGALNLFADAIRDTSGDLGRSRRPALDSALLRPSVTGRVREAVAAANATIAANAPVSPVSSTSSPSPSEPGSAAAAVADEPGIARAAGLTISVDGGSREIVHEIDFVVPEGASVGFVGESGSGKTLTCRALLGILPSGASITGGQVSYRSRDLSKLDSKQWRGLYGSEIAAVFQDPASYLNPSITVGKQLSEVLRAKKGLNKKDARAEALVLFESMGLRHPELVYTQYPFQLSGGMLQRVLIAISISAEPDLLIADEATTALDVTVQAEVLTLLERLRQERNLSLIMVSHDLAVIAQVCDFVNVFLDGRIVETGRTEDVLNNPQHDYTKQLIESYERYGIDRVRAEAVS